MDVSRVLEAHETRLNALDKCVDDVGKTVSSIQGKMESIELLVKWVITPLLVIVAGLVGIKLLFPGA